MSAQNYKKIICDLCRKETTVKENDKPENWYIGCLPVKFVTEQTEGTSTTPYLGKANVDMCPECYKKYIDNFPIKAAGAQGYNKFFWNDEHVTLMR